MVLPTRETGWTMTSPQFAATPRARENATTAPAREGGLDALRAATTLLVVFHHAALTYGAIGGWFYREVPTDGRLEIKFLILFCTLNQAWFMGLFFLIAGYFTPRAVARHGAWGYLKERFFRLGLPLLAFGFFVGPLTIALAQTARGRNFGATLLWLWDHRVFENGPLWFAQALLNFSLLFVAWRWLAGRAIGKTGYAKAPPFPSNRMMIGALLITGAGAFALRLVWPVGENFVGL
jgi:peptidoglycan/LPS O-acetylase OafA/YrhL